MDSLRAKKIKKISKLIVKTQEPIRILNAIQWSPEVKEDFFKNKCKQLPCVDADFYKGRPLGFDPEKIKETFAEIQKTIKNELSLKDPAAKMMNQMCQEYQLVADMLKNRGTPLFGKISKKLYGSAEESLYKTEPSLADLCDVMKESFTNLKSRISVSEEEKNIDAKTAVKMLRQRLRKVFATPTGRQIKVILSDGILADAAAGSNYLKIRRGAILSKRDIQMLEVHEGWVHLGTTLNGAEQKICTFLSKGAPSSTVTQEGLAVLMEILTFTSYPGRLNKLTNRTRAIHIAEQCGDFLDVFNFFRSEDYTEEESYKACVRVFRGSHPCAGPFTKDISYHKGFLLIYNYIRLAVQKGNLDRVPLLFCGKVTLDQIRFIETLIAEGLVTPPAHLPPMIADMRGLSAWMCYSNFLNHFNLKKISTDYARLLI